MRKFANFLYGVGGIAGLIAAVPAAAQYYDRGYNGAYTNQYQNYENEQQWRHYRGAYHVDTGMAQQQCTSAVQSRLNSHVGLGSIIGSMVGTSSTPRVIGVAQVVPRSDGTIRVRGFATSGHMAHNNYGPYGVGAYGALGYGYANAADLSFRCDVGPNGDVYNVSINRR